MSVDYSLIWKEMADQIQKELTGPEVVLLSSLNYHSATQDSITATVSTNFIRDQIVKRYLAKMEAKIHELVGHEVRILLEVSAPTTAIQGPAVQESDVKHHEAYSAPPSPPQHVAMPVKPKSPHENLQSSFTFDDYVISDNNSFAANAAIAISKNPGIAYNPFLIYGGVGLGKTHLMQAIGNYIYSNNDAKIIYVTAETFTNDFISSLYDKKTMHFKNKYRNADVLLIDDIHFFDRTNEVQEELFHTFNALYDNKKQMVFTCDRPVMELKKLSDRLRSRFERGLNVDLAPPDMETRHAILKKKMLLHPEITIDDEVLSLVAKNISTNVRDLEAALTKLIAYNKLVRKPITLETSRDLLKDTFASPKQSNMTIDHILKVVANESNLSPSDLKGKKRTKNIILPRQIAMYIAREITEYSTSEIGSEFGGRDHTTVIHSCGKIENMIKADPTLDVKIKNLIRTMKEYSAKSG